MESVLKLRLRLDPASKMVLESQSKITNWLYNHLLEEANKLRFSDQKSQSPEIAKILYSKRGLRNLVPSLKNEYPFLRTVYSSPLKNAALRLSGAIQDYQQSRKGKRKGKKTGWPKFRSFKRKFFSLLYDEPGKGWKIDGKKICISLGVDENRKRIYVYGELEKFLSDFTEKEVRNLRITRDEKDFYCVFTVKEKEVEQKKIRKVIALDPNHKNLVYGTGSDGNGFEIMNPWFLKPLQKRIDQLKSKRDKCKRKSKKLILEGDREVWLSSKRYNRINKRLQNVYRKRREQTKTYLYTVSNWLCSNYDLISIGDYTPKGGGVNKGMRRAMNNESLIGRLKLTCMWKCKKSGKHYYEWNERGSTRTCCGCGQKVHSGLSPNIRIWICSKCSRVHYRDENAAINGLKRTLKEFQFPGSGHLLEDILEIKNSNKWALRYDGLGLKRKLNPGANV